MIRMLMPFFSRHEIAKDRVEGRFSIQKDIGKQHSKVEKCQFYKGDVPDGRFGAKILQTDGKCLL